MSSVVMTGRRMNNPVKFMASRRLALAVLRRRAARHRRAAARTRAAPPRTRAPPPPPPPRRHLPAPPAGVLSDDLHLGVRREPRLAIGHDALAVAEPAGDHRSANPRCARPSPAAAAPCRCRHDVHVRAPAGPSRPPASAPRARSARRTGRSGVDDELAGPQPTGSGFGNVALSCTVPVVVSTALSMKDSVPCSGWLSAVSCDVGAPRPRPDRTPDCADPPARPGSPRPTDRPIGPAAGIDDVARTGIGRGARPRAARRPYFCSSGSCVDGIGEAHENRAHLIDHDERRRPVAMHEVAFAHEQRARASGDRRANRRVVEIELRVRDCGLVRTTRWPPCARRSPAAGPPAPSSRSPAARARRSAANSRCAFAAFALSRASAASACWYAA